MQTRTSFTSVLTILSAAAGVGALVLTTGLFVTAGSRDASASAKYAQATGKPCAFCHATPPALNDQGKKFQANGHKL